MRRGTKRKAASQKAEADKHKESSKATRTIRTTKRVKKSEDPRNLQDLWKAAFPVGTNNVYLLGYTKLNLTCLLSPAHLLCSVFFIPLRLNSETRIVFFAAQSVSINGENKVVCIPVAVAVVSPFPPSDMIGVNSVQREAEEIIPMKQMKMVGFHIFLWRTGAL
ncbi:hypothetical protein D8674_013212 [Pyrus ussuriensis x Pyrus communis]|uniref:Uncharacterized protein n=1 Tax=Pyrus ussuriensis x Pyrus communis TaxID=2448454 RepID=A0A5N5GRM4_9ROSA|nr:hypothetical protein D8674_013212 [Pyrus ussuriensis x Pyrus communis]